MSMPEARRSPEGVVQRRAQRKLVEPFIRDLPTSQLRLTLLRSRKYATASTAEDRLHARIELGKLLHEVQATMRQFDCTMVEHAPEGALRDVRLALRRLADHISQELS